MTNFKKLTEIMALLRKECLWDREQTHQSLQPHLIEEAYETVEAINSNNSDNLKEELGDLLLQVVFHAEIAQECNSFNIDDVIEGICEKLIHRHPHVFSDVKVQNSQEIVENWDKIKLLEKNKEDKSMLSGVKKSQPALMQALDISKKATKAGFEWTDVDSLLECVRSEIDEFENEIKRDPHVGLCPSQDDIPFTTEGELGDILFSVVNLARWYKINPEIALVKANEKFIKRFKKMETLSNGEFKKNTTEEMEELWKRAKTLT